MNQISGIPEEVYHQNFIERDFSFSPSQSSTYYSSVKEYKPVSYENGYSPYKTMEEKSQRHPMLRLEISPDTVPKIPENAYSTSLRYQEKSNSSSVAPRYALSDIVGLNKYGSVSKSRNGSFWRNFHAGTVRDTVHGNSLPTSPTGLVYYQRSGNSRSMSNLFEKENVYQPGTTGEIKNIMQPVKSGMTMESHFRNTYRKTSQAASVASGGAETSGKKVFLTTALAAARENDFRQARGEGTLSESQVGSLEVDMTLERAVSLLDSETASSYWISAAASFIQHECFLKAIARAKVYSLGGISKLLRLLSNENEDIQQAACAALRNLVFEDNDNKSEVCKQHGIPVLVQLLKQTRNVDTKKQIAGLFWNLSSNDQLKSMLIKEVLKPLTEKIIIPCSGWTEGDYPKTGAMSDPDIFYNATGCLRNLSSEGPEGRRQLRECEGLIDSLVHYVRGTVADYQPDDKSTENCVCILHNLSYQLESELPTSYTRNIYLQNRNIPKSSKSVGCFGIRTKKIKEQQKETPFPEEKSNPKGVEWLWHSIVIRMYLSLIAKSSRNYTQEAALGALQNLTAGNGPMSFAVAQTIVQKENGLQHIRSMMNSSNPGVRKTAVSLLRNLSHNSSVHKDLVKYIVPDLVTLLPNSAQDSTIDSETTASMCYLLNNLIQHNSQNAQTLLNNGGLVKVFDISISDGNLSTKAGKAASVVLYYMWQHNDLHSAYKKANFKKTDFINSRTAKAYHSLKD
ncbi:plakophilin-2 isoform X2 [Microcaecilia unicolor]|nr:plakophilin-2 isoform X2 [Microcaecilia unicolor]